MRHRESWKGWQLIWRQITYLWYRSLRGWQDCPGIQPRTPHTSGPCILEDTDRSPVCLCPGNTRDQTGCWAWSEDTDTPDTRGRSWGHRSSLEDTRSLVSDTLRQAVAGILGHRVHRRGQCSLQDTDTAPHTRFDRGQSLMELQSPAPRHWQWHPLDLTSNTELGSGSCQPPPVSPSDHLCQQHPLHSLHQHWHWWTSLLRRYLARISLTPHCHSQLLGCHHNMTMSFLYPEIIRVLTYLYFDKIRTRMMMSGAETVSAWPPGNRMLNLRWPP